jgi:hypothetical protein
MPDQKVPMQQRQSLIAAVRERLREDVRQELFDNLTVAEVKQWAAQHGLELVTRTMHVPLPSDGAAAFRCTCGFAGSIPCPTANRRLL